MHDHHAYVEQLNAHAKKTVSVEVETVVANKGNGRDRFDGWRRRARSTQQTVGRFLVRFEVLPGGEELLRVIPRI